MARKLVTVIEDDLDGSEASQTLTFSLDGAEYEIDLNEAHADELRSVFSRYTNAARKTSAGRNQPAARKTTTGGTDSKAIRQWALDNGFHVNARGRIQADVVEKYLAAQ